MVNQIVSTTNLNHNVVQTVPFQLGRVMILVKYKWNLKKLQIKTYNSIIGACCDEGSCHLTLGDSACAGGVFQGEGSNCGARTCPLGNVCCQNDRDQFCLSGVNDVERCTGPGQFAAQNCNECVRRFSDLTVSILSRSEQVSLSQSMFYYYYFLKLFCHLNWLSILFIQR